MKWHYSRLFVASLMLAALNLTGCNKDPAPQSAALDAETIPAKPPEAASAVETPPPPAVPEAPAAQGSEPAQSYAATPITMPNAPPAIFPAVIPTTVEPKPEESKTPTIDPQRIEVVEAQMRAQRESLDQLKVNQIELHSLIESLSAELHQATQRQARLKPTAGIGASRASRRHRAVQDAPTPPFAVESVDTWGNEKRVVVLTQEGRRDLKLGDTYAGWTVQDGSDGNQASFRDPAGHDIRLGVTWR